MTALTPTSSLAPLVLKVPSTILPGLIDKLSNLTTEHAVDSSVRATALRTVVTSLPRPVPGVPSSRAAEDAYAAVSRVLIPRMVGYLVMPHPPSSTLSAPPVGLLEIGDGQSPDGDTLDVLIEVVRCFGPVLLDSEIRALQKAVMNLLESERVGSVVKKRAVVAMSVLAIYFSDAILSSFVSQTIEGSGSLMMGPVVRRLTVRQNSGTRISPWSSVAYS